jgi:4-hydroxy-2-oxoheptanedioate aldolase
MVRRVTSDAADLRRRLAAGEACTGVWSLLPGAVTGEVLARTGAEYVFLDLQHGALDERDLPAVTATVVAGGSVPLVRTRSASPADVGRPLDLGAHGVLVPNVGGADHVREVVTATRYAPGGHRSIGRLSGGADRPLVFVMVETAAALEDLDAVLAVEGLDGVYVGPGDLGLALGLASAGDRPRLREVVAAVVARAVAARVPVGVHASSGADAAAWAAQGTTIVTAAVDLTVLADGVRDQLTAARAALPEGRQP